jgi:CRISPR system Cascade subunit CasE
MLYLSRFTRPDGHGSLHRYVMAGFPDDLGPDPRKQAGVLFRVQVNQEPDFFAAKNDSELISKRECTEAGSILVQSVMKPKWPRSYDAEVKLEFGHNLLELGGRYRFRFGLNSVAQSNRDGRCRRYPVSAADWLAVREERLGATFEVRQVRVQKHHDHVRREHYTRSFPVEVSVIDGYLTVTHSQRLADAMVNGIGREKAYGCGLLSLLPVAAVTTPEPAPALVGVSQG